MEQPNLTGQVTYFPSTQTVNILYGAILMGKGNQALFA